MKVNIKKLYLLYILYTKDALRYSYIFIIKNIRENGCYSFKRKIYPIKNFYLYKANKMK